MPDEADTSALTVNSVTLNKSILSWNLEVCVSGGQGNLKKKGWSTHMISGRNIEPSPIGEL